MLDFPNHSHLGSMRLLEPDDHAMPIAYPLYLKHCAREYVCERVSVYWMNTAQQSQSHTYMFRVVCRDNGPCRCFLASLLHARLETLDCFDAVGNELH